MWCLWVGRAGSVPERDRDETKKENQCSVATEIQGNEFQDQKEILKNVFSYLWRSTCLDVLSRLFKFPHFEQKEVG